MSTVGTFSNEDTYKSMFSLTKVFAKNHFKLTLNYTNVFKYTKSTMCLILNLSI